MKWGCCLSTAIHKFGCVYLRSRRIFNPGGCICQEEVHMECPYTSGTAVIVRFTRKGICVNGHFSLKVKEMIVDGKGFIFYSNERQPARITRTGSAIIDSLHEKLRSKILEAVIGTCGKVFYAGRSTWPSSRPTVSGWIATISISLAIKRKKMNPD